MVLVVVAVSSALVALGIEYYVVAIAYPAFAIVGPEEFAALHALHSTRIAYAIGPALLAAFAANALLVAQRPRGVPLWLCVVAVIAGAAILSYTAFIAVPIHARLAAGFDARAVAALNATEWIRAFATLAQAVCDVAILWYACGMR